MGFTEENNDEIISGINITPLVDIMLVLLILFMLVSSIMDVNAIKVDLPRAATGEEGEEKTISVLISKTGEFYLGDRQMASFDALKEALAVRQQENPGIQVAISADRKTYHQEVIRVIDMLRQIHIDRFAINVEYQEYGGKP